MQSLLLKQNDFLQAFSIGVIWTIIKKEKEYFLSQLNHQTIKQIPVS